MQHLSSIPILISVVGHCRRQVDQAIRLEWVTSIYKLSWLQQTPISHVGGLDVDLMTLVVAHSYGADLRIQKVDVPFGLSITWLFNGSEASVCPGFLFDHAACSLVKDVLL